LLALRLITEGSVACEEIAAPPPPRAGEARLRMRAIALNHIDLWGMRGMAFAKRTLPLTVGVEGVGVVEALGAGADGPPPGTRVAVYSGLVCGRCRACREGRENLCEAAAGIMGFHVDGLAAQQVNVPARLLVPILDGPSWSQAACGPVTFATVQHMLFDNARLEPGESILVHSAGSGVGSTAILMARQLGCTIFATVGSEEKIERARAIGADHVINYRTERFEGVIRRLTKKRGVDVVFEHIGPDTWNGSLFSLARGGRLVTCGSTSGFSAETNLFHLFQQQLRITGSFGANFRNIRDGYAKMAAGTVLPVIDSEIPLQDLGAGLKRMQDRQVFGKIIVHIP
jgi:NADPH:quinone reductase-like Zn-dependent oxidoreductase